MAEPHPTEPVLGAESTTERKGQQSGKDNTSTVERQPAWVQPSEPPGPVVTEPDARGADGERRRKRAEHKGQGEAGRRRRARPQWDLLPAHERNDGSVDRVGRCYACLVGRAAAQAGQASGKQGSTHSNAGKRALSAVEPIERGLPSREEGWDASGSKRGWMGCAIVRGRLGSLLEGERT